MYMKKYRIVFLIFLFSVYKIDAQDVVFGWNVGNVKIYGDVLTSVCL